MTRGWIKIELTVGSWSSWGRDESVFRNVAMGWSQREGQLVVMLVVDFDLDCRLIDLG